MIKRRDNPRFTKTIGGWRDKRRLEIEYVSIATLSPALRNAHTHSQKQIRQLTDTIRHLGFNNPVIVDEQNRIVAGHGRVEAAKMLGMSEVPIIRLSHLTGRQIRAYMLADNKLAEKAGWDRDLLRIELSELAILLPEIDLDLSITGFEPAEVDSILVDFEADGCGPADDLPPIDKVPVARPGDLFLLGRHRLYVGDARRPESYAKLMGTETAVMAILDPPYNVRISNVGGRGRIKHREFIIASGELNTEQFIEFLTQGLRLCAMHSVDGAIHFVFMDWRHMHDLLEAGKAVYAELKNVCVWTKNIAGQGSFYRSQHELVFVFKHGTAPNLNNFELGQHGRTRSNVWPYAGVNSFRAGRLDELKMHPTVKPVALVADAMRDCSRRGDIVLDAFAGSGTTIIAAELIGRRAHCMEIDPLYADVCIRRWQVYTKRDAVLEGTGQSFDELTVSRCDLHDPASTTPPSQRGMRPVDHPSLLPSSGDKPKRASRSQRGQPTPRTPPHPAKGVSQNER